jgi:hypothetical protein
MNRLFIIIYFIQNTPILSQNSMNNHFNSISNFDVNFNINNLAFIIDLKIVISNSALHITIPLKKIIIHVINKHLEYNSS